MRQAVPRSIRRTNTVVMAIASAVLAACGDEQPGVLAPEQGVQGTDAPTAVSAAGDPIPGAGDRILMDARQKLQAATTLGEAECALRATGTCSPTAQPTAETGFTTDMDGLGTNALRKSWRGMSICDDANADYWQVQLPSPYPRSMYLSWKMRMGRTATGGGLGALNAFDITNENCGNAGRKVLLVLRDLPDLGGQGRIDYLWPGSAPVQPSVGFQPLNRGTFQPQDHVGQTIQQTIYLQAESSPTANDGILRLWVNGTLVLEFVGDVGPEAFHRFHFPSTFRAPIQDQTEYWWDMVAWEPGGAGTPTRTLTRVNATPDTATLAPGATRQFSATGTYSDGTTGGVTAAWSATGGTVSAGGLYTAPAAAGSYRVIARESATGLADTSTVTVTAAAPAPTLQQVTVTPGTATVTTGGTVQFSASGRYSDGTNKAVAVTWSATGGTVSTAGLYTAGQTAGSYRVIAVAQGSTRADTSAVTVTSPQSDPPAGSYTTLLGDDWRSYSSKTALSTYYSSAELTNVDLATDATYGQVVRLRQNAGSTASPRLSRKLPAPASRVWYRWRARYSPGYTLGGSVWTMGQLTWSGWTGASSLGFTGTNHTLGFNVRNASTGAYQQYAETLLAGSSNPFGGVGSAFTDGQWYEYVLLWEKTGTTTGRSHWWARKLGGAWTYYGISLSGATTPQVDAVSLGAGNLGRAPAATQYVFLGPWEVVDGTRFANPFGMTGF